MRKNEPTGEVRQDLCQPCLGWAWAYTRSVQKILFGAGGERNDRWTHG